VLELRVHPEDIGHVVGQNGRIAEAIRTILGAVGRKLKEYVKVEILDYSLRPRIGSARCAVPLLSPVSRQIIAQDAAVAQRGDPASIHDSSNYGALFTKTLLLSIPGVAEKDSPPRSRKRGLLAEESNGLTNEPAL